MVARTDQKARLFDLTANVSELVRDGKRDPDEVAAVLQAIKDAPDFIQQLSPAGKIKMLEIPFSIKESIRGWRHIYQQVREWQVFYRQVFGLEKDFSDLLIPIIGKSEFNRLIIVVQGMTADIIFKKLSKLMPAGSSFGLDIIRSVREADKDYAIWVRNRQEADEELANQSADDLKKQGINCITLEERFLYEIKYFKETGKHLDKKNSTLCAGSRDDCGDVPRVNWNGAEVNVHWCSVGDLRTRAVVS